MTESTAARRAREAYWDAAYRDRGARGVSWFQPTPTVSIELVHCLGIPTAAAILDVGGGESALVDTLLAEGFRHVSVLDISGVALEGVRKRLGVDAPVTLIHDDLLTWTPSPSFDVWHDRAVLHFLVEEGARQAYLDRMHHALHPGGHVILGTFASDGPRLCSGLAVARYTADELARLLGEDFEVLERRREEHVTPAGVLQPFTWLAARLREQERPQAGSWQDR